MAERIFDILFTVSIQHDLLQQGYQDSFRIIPAPASRQTISRYGLIFKPWVENDSARPLYRQTEGFRILIEKMVDNGIEVPVRKFSTLTGFLFEIYLNRPDLLYKVEPFTKLEDGSRKPQTLNVPFGKSIWYFDNMELDGTLMKLDGTLDDKLKLTSDTVVSSGDMWILVPERYEIPIIGSVSKLTVQSLSNPSLLAKEYVITSEQTTVSVNLSPDIYRFSWSGGNINHSFVVVNNELYISNVFGVIQIFKNQHTDFNKVENYLLRFKI